MSLDDSRDEHARLRNDLGAYALGQLDAEQAERMDRHVESCERCRGDLREIAPAVSALGEIRDTPLPSLGDPPDHLEDRVVAALGQERRQQERRGWLRSAALAVAAASAAAAVLVGGYALTRPEPEPPPVTVPMERVPVEVAAAEVEATAALVNHTWGVEVKLTATGFATGQPFRAVVLDGEGNASPAGEFVGVGEREMLCNLNSAVLRSEAAGFEILDQAGTVLVSSDFPDPPADAP